MIWCFEMALYQPCETREWKRNAERFHRRTILLPLCMCKLNYLWLFLTLPLHKFWVLKGKEKNLIIFLYFSIVGFLCCTTQRNETKLNQTKYLLLAHPVPIYIYIYICMCVCVCVCLWIYICVYTYMCIYMYVYIYVYTYMFVYMHILPDGFSIKWCTKIDMQFSKDTAVYVYGGESLWHNK